MTDGHRLMRFTNSFAITYSGARFQWSSLTVELTEQFNDCA